MLLLLLCGMFSMLPTGSAVINCRMACRRCREETAYPEMLEVYCAMCDECKERRKEWLQGQRNLRMQNGNYLRNDLDLEGYEEDCPTPPTEEPCEEPILLAKKITTTTTTTTTTRRPCTPKPHCVTNKLLQATRTPCFPMPCSIVPIAMPVCQMCPSLGAMSSVPTSSIVPLLSKDKKAADSSTGASESMYFYVGVPKKLLKDLKLLRT